jgi:hypothetical protein
MADLGISDPSNIIHGSALETPDFLSIAPFKIEKSPIHLNLVPRNLLLISLSLYGKPLRGPRKKIYPIALENTIESYGKDLNPMVPLSPIGVALDGRFSEDREAFLECLVESNMKRWTFMTRYVIDQLFLLING